MLTNRGRPRSLSHLVIFLLAAVSTSCGPPREHSEQERALALAEETRYATAPDGVAKLVVTSPAFEPGGDYPADFTCDGSSASPPVEWTAGPNGTRCYALEVWHIPGPGSVKSYWVVYNIPAEVTKIPRNATHIGVEGTNDKGHKGYDPMCSRGPGQKTYHITVHALSAELNQSGPGLNRAELLAAIQHTELARGTLTFTYTRH